MIQNKILCIFSFQGGKGTHIKTLEVYNVKCKNTRGVYCKNNRGVYCKNTRGVYCKNTRGVYCKTLEVFVYQIFTGGDILIIPNIELV